MARRPKIAVYEQRAAAIADDLLEGCGLPSRDTLLLPAGTSDADRAVWLVAGRIAAIGVYADQLDDDTRDAVAVKLIRLGSALRKPA